MLPIRWDPFKELSLLRRDIDDFFRRTFRGEEGTVLSPAVNAFIAGNEYCIEAEIPGVDRKDLDVSVEGNILTLRGERKMSRKSREEDYLLQESRYGSFLRRMTLPEGVDTERIHATYDSGVLRITMPINTKEVTGRKVEVQELKLDGTTEGKQEESQQNH